jgi:2-oxo-4-hydroxy-4-carboxy-5-ureidoimidazoline decarboxylase
MSAALVAINAMHEPAFVAAFRDIAESSPWVAEAASWRRPFADRAAMIAAFTEAIGSADRTRQLALLRAHPDLAGRAAIAGDLLPDSTDEQRSAGLDRLTAEEFAAFTAYNTRYRERFGFPFILAVRGTTKHDVLAAFVARIDNDPATELATAIAQVQRIVRLRIEQRIAPD